MYLVYLGGARKILHLEIVLQMGRGRIRRVGAQWILCSTFDSLATRLGTLLQLFWMVVIHPAIAGSAILSAFSFPVPRVVVFLWRVGSSL